MTAREAVALSMLTLGLFGSSVRAQSPPNVYEAVLLEEDQKTLNISTEELRTILADKTTTVFDVRPFQEYAIDHIPGAVNVAQKPGTTREE